MVVVNTLPSVVVPLITGRVELTGAGGGPDVCAPFTAMFIPICIIYQRATISEAAVT